MTDINDLTIDENALTPRSFERMTLFKSDCCGNNSTIDKRALLFITQIIMSIFAVSISAIQLCFGSLTEGEKNAWFILLTGTISVWLPNPQLH